MIADGVRQNTGFIPKRTAMEGIVIADGEHDEAAKSQLEFVDNPVDK